MRFLADENFPGAAIAALETAGCDVVWVRIVAPGATDQDVLETRVLEIEGSAQGPPGGHPNALVDSQGVFQSLNVALDFHLCLAHESEASPDKVHLIDPDRPLGDVSASLDGGFESRARSFLNLNRLLRLPENLS